MRFDLSIYSIKPSHWRPVRQLFDTTQLAFNLPILGFIYCDPRYRFADVKYALPISGCSTALKLEVNVKVQIRYLRLKTGRNLPIYSSTYWPLVLKVLDFFHSSNPWKVHENGFSAWKFWNLASEVLESARIPNGSIIFVMWKMMQSLENCKQYSEHQCYYPSRQF